MKNMVKACNQHMLERIQNCYNQYCHKSDKLLIAKSMLEDLSNDLIQIPTVESGSNAIENLGQALENYFKRKDLKCSIRFLEHFVAVGDFNYDTAECPENFQADRYQRIHSLLTNIFGTSGIPVNKGVEE